MSADFAPLDYMDDVIMFAQLSALPKPNYEDKFPPISQAPKLQNRSTIPNPAMLSRHTTQAIVIKMPIPLRASQKSLFDLPGELRNEIYYLALEMHRERIPLNRYYKGKPDPGIPLLQTSSQVFHEARSLMANTATAYIPVMPGMDWTLANPEEGYKLLPEIKTTTVQALAEFMNVHFHLHVVAVDEKTYSPGTLLESLEGALHTFIANSARVSAKHKAKKRHAIVHFDHFFSLWARKERSALARWASYQGIGPCERLISIMAKDTNTFWDIRYYVAMGEGDTPIKYKWRELDLAELKSYCRRYGELHLTELSVQAEVYGKHIWEEGERLSGVVKTRTPHSNLWPNVHLE